jgi:hypothetical protein
MRERRAEWRVGGPRACESWSFRTRRSSCCREAWFGCNNTAVLGPARRQPFSVRCCLPLSSSSGNGSHLKWRDASISAVWWVELCFALSLLSSL